MKLFVDKNLGTLIHIYDYLHDGYYASHNQLFYYNEKVYQLYIDEQKTELYKFYNKLKTTFPDYVISAIEKSAGIRYFCCDGMHDANINQVYYNDDYLCIELDTSKMLGCLNLCDKICTLKLKTISIDSCDYLLNDINTFESLFWLNNEISFDENNIYFDIELQAFKNQSYQNIKYQFIIDEIIII